MRIKTPISIAATAFFVALPTYLFSQTWKEDGARRMEVTGIEVRAIASAFRVAEVLKMDLDNYKLSLVDNERSYTASFIDCGKPTGFRGSRPGFPQPTLVIDKASGQVLEQTLSR
jgi:hypothetical protein